MATNKNIGNANPNLERTDYKLVLNNHLGRLSLLSFKLLDRQAGGYYIQMDSFKAGLDALKQLLKAYHNNDFKKKYKGITKTFKEAEKKELDLLNEKTKKQQVHGAGKESREKIMDSRYTFLMDYLGELIILMHANDLLLEEQEYDAVME